MLKAETEKAEQVLALNHSSVESRLREGKWWKSVMWLVGDCGQEDDYWGKWERLLLIAQELNSLVCFWNVV